MATTPTTSGVIYVKRSKMIAQFVYGDESSATYSTRLGALNAAQAFRANHRRSNRCSIVEVVGETVTELYSAEEGQAPAAPKGLPKPKADKKVRRKQRRERKKLDMIAIREKLESMSVKELADEMRDADDGRIKHAAFRETRAQLSMKAATRVYCWKLKGWVDVCEPHIGNFR